MVVFFQHLGFVFASSVAVNPDFDVFVRSDEAVITLASNVTGIAPARINTVAEPALGTLADVVGFGSIGDPVPANAGRRAGILRRGDVVTSGCSGVPDPSHVCFSFENPIGPAGTDSSTCFGDSGGPMFAPISGLGTAVIGVASGVSNQTCRPPTVPSTPTSPSITTGSWAPRAETSRRCSAPRSPPRSGPTPRLPSPRTR